MEDEHDALGDVFRQLVLGAVEELGQDGVLGVQVLGADDVTAVELVRVARVDDDALLDDVVVDAVQHVGQLWTHKQAS